jgi:hypothetical protein
MKRFLKLFLIILLVVAAFFYFGCLIYYSQTKVERHDVIPSLRAASRENEIDWIPVHWAANDFSDRAAMYVPVWLDTIRKPFWMQFDLGTPYSDLYPISHYFPYLKEKELVLERLSFHQRQPVYYTGISLNIGRKLPYRVTAIPIYDRLTADSLVEKPEGYETKIGNLGYDLIRGRILILDFKNSQIAITDSLPGDWQIDYFSKGNINQFPIFLPVTIDGREKLMQYDNGASAFTIISTEDQWNQWRDHRRQPDTFAGTSWGRKELYFRSAPAVSIRIAGRDVSPLPVWGMNRRRPAPKNLLQYLKKITDEKFGKTFPATLGNAYFRNEVLVLDTKHNRAGIRSR